MATTLRSFVQGLLRTHGDAERAWVEFHDDLRRSATDGELDEYLFFEMQEVHKAEIARLLDEMLPTEDEMAELYELVKLATAAAGLPFFWRDCSVNGTPHNCWEVGPRGRGLVNERGEYVRIDDSLRHNMGSPSTLRRMIDWCDWCDNTLHGERATRAPHSAAHG